MTPVPQGDPDGNGAVFVDVNACWLVAAKGCAAADLRLERALDAAGGKGSSRGRAAPDDKPVAKPKLDELHFNFARGSLDGDDVAHGFSHQRPRHGALPGNGAPGGVALAFSHDLPLLLHGRTPGHRLKNHSRRTKADFFTLQCRGINDLYILQQ